MEKKEREGERRRETCIVWNCEVPYFCLPQGIQLCIDQHLILFFLFLFFWFHLLLFLFFPSFSFSSFLYFSFSFFPFLIFLFYSIILNQAKEIERKQIETRGRRRKKKKKRKEKGEKICYLLMMVFVG